MMVGIDDEHELTCLCYPLRVLLVFFFCDYTNHGGALQGEWFRTGDLAVQHAGGRVELKDREKDIIIRLCILCARIRLSLLVILWR